ncbi:toxin-antitoxin system YwqK family antitoxin [Pedobacter namyangjuensis]|uniref:toxin-antitoxin system YwqK family antitoxin n=1 Tax=Pedobacter namyangjuensis TaxID=600626 RepID=UPI000DE3D077|nr:hypothetical protein [Pedobacter namyangjuensis]
MIKKILLTFVLALSVTLCIGQAKPIYFYGDKITTDKDKITSYGIYGKLSTEDIWTFKRFDLYDNLLQTGSYADSLLTIPHGKFIFYGDIQAFNNLNLTTYRIKNKFRYTAQEGNFVNGLEQGPWYNYYPDGNILSVQNFKDGKLNGLFVSRDRYGKDIITGNFVNGEKDGEWRFEKEKRLDVFEAGILKSSTYIKKEKKSNN